MSYVQPHQFVPIDGVRNFRDFGGYQTSQHQCVKRSYLFRSGHYAAITPSGLARLAQTGISTVVDLRRGQERQNSPSQLNGLKIETIYSTLGDGDGVSLPPHLLYIRDGDLSVQGCHNHMLSSYRRIPWELQHGETFLKTFQKLAQSDGPLVIHCAAGKDRTGILCGLILHTLGVSRDDIMHDYLLTNDVPTDETWLGEYARRMSVMFEKTIDPEMLVPMLGVHSDFLNLAWDEMERRDGGLDGYLDKIGVTDELRSNVAHKLLERSTTCVDNNQD